MQQSTDNTLTQQDMIDKSYKKLTADELIDILSDTTITGKYFYNNTWFKFMVNSFKDGRVKGENSVGTYDKGRWKVHNDNSMSIVWEGSWKDGTNFAYKVNDEIMLFDTITEEWETTYTLVQNGKLPTDV